VRAIVRYVADDVVHSQRWVAPFILFAAAVAIINSGSGPILATYGATAGCLLPVSTWLTMVVVNAEDPVHAQVSIVTVGNDVSYRLGKLLTAFLAGAGLAVLGVMVPVFLHDYTDRHPASAVAAGVAGLLLVVLFGVAVGAVASRPVIARTGWALLVAAAACLADVVTAHAPPTRQLLVLFDQDHPTHLAGSLALMGAETLVIFGALTVVALALARRRT
jgi:hypothetical protein